MSSAQQRIGQVAGHVHAPPNLLPRQASGFQYTLDEFSEGVLTREEREFIEENGYLIRRRVIDEDFVKMLNDRFLEYANGSREILPHMKLMKDIGFLRQVKSGALPKELLKTDRAVYKLTNFCPTLYSWVQHPGILEVARAFAGRDLKSLHHMYINKPPDANNTGIHPLHQDMGYFPWTPAQRTVGVWTALSKVNTENGCLVVIPGSHKRGLQDHVSPKWMQNVGFHAISEVSDIQNLNDISLSRVPLLAAEMEPGDTLFFSPYLFHGSGVNRTGEARRSIVCHFANAASRFIRGKFEPAQEFISKDSQLSLTGVDLPYDESHEAWIENWVQSARPAAGIDWRELTGDKDYL